MSRKDSATERQLTPTVSGTPPAPAKRSAGNAPAGDHRDLPGRLSRVFGVRWMAPRRLGVEPVALLSLQRLGGDIGNDAVHKGRKSDDRQDSRLAQVGLDLLRSL